MGRIAQRFEALRSRGEAALIPFLTAGDPDLQTTERLVLAMAESGADLIELGVPFSDPQGEGPTIQRASERALAGGATLRRILASVERLRPQIEVPLLLMGYANPILTMGEQDFARSAAEVGVDGIIVADLPPEEGAELFARCRDASVDPVLLAAPTTPDDRLRYLMGETRGFLYYVSLSGVTGARETLTQGVEDRVRAAQGMGPAPVCVGFGISTAQHAKQVASFADGVVVGSAIVNRVAASSSSADAVDQVASFCAELKAPLRG